MTRHTALQSADHKKTPERRCIVRGVVGPKTALIRFVVGPDGAAVPDLTGKLPGRGVYVTGERGALEEAIAKKAFARAAKRAVKAPADLVDRTGHLVRQRLLNHLGLARRAGAMVVGYEQVLRAVQADAPVHLLLTARDAAEDGARKIRAKTDQGVMHLAAFDRLDLSAALGLPNVVHAAIVGSGRFGPEAVKKLMVSAMWVSGFEPTP